MKNFNLTFMILLGLFFSSCEREEISLINEGTLEISRITLQEYASGSTNARVQASSTWEHIFAGELSLNIRSTTTGLNYELKFNPNDLAASSGITLPYGDYTYQLQHSADNILTYLPITASGEFRLNAATLQLTLDASTNYGLVTVEKTNVRSAPTLVLNQASTSMVLRGDYYYAYVKETLEPSLEVIENIFGNTIRRTLSIQAYKHYNFIVRVSDGTGKVIDIILRDFDLIEEDLLVNTGTVPSTYSLTFLTNLSSTMSESSGLAFLDGELWTHNDSGNSNDIFQFSQTSGSITKIFTVNNETNIDWEDLAQSSTHLFVGDFGNNNGDRTDLTIFKIPKSEIATSNSASAEKITFTYPDQTDFSSAPNANNFDCEAFFFANDSLYLFSKNWLDSQTKVYALPSTPGNYIAKLKTSFNTQGLVTAAAINSLTGDIVLLGYTNQGLSSESFVWLLSGYSGFDFFNGKKNRITLGSILSVGQTEGIFLSTNNSGWISSESIGLLNIPAKLFSFDFKNFF